MTENSPSLPRQSATVTPSLQARIADELRRNDACGTGPLSDDEYMEDAAAILRIFDEHPPAGVRYLQARNERMRKALQTIAGLRGHSGAWEMLAENALKEVGPVV